MNTLLVKVPRASSSRLAPLCWSNQVRCLSAHTWYRASITSHEYDGGNESSLGTSHHHHHRMNMTMVDAPETALGSIALQEVVSEHDDDDSSMQQWSNSLSFSSPESDFVSWSYASSFLPTPNNDSFIKVKMMDAPETALGSVAVNEFLESSTRKHHQDSNLIQETTLDNRESLYYTVDQPETALGSVALSELVSKNLVEQLVQQQQQQHDEKLPTSLLEYYKGAATDHRAMVVTSCQKPFQVVDVNDAWVGLCGYTRGESIDQTLGDLLQGPDTNQKVLQEFVEKLSHGEEATATIVNYTKMGRKFVNRVHAGPLYNEVSGDITHFVGVLTEIDKQGETVTQSKQ